jgi:hypothetical protein
MLKATYNIIVYIKTLKKHWLDAILCVFMLVPIKGFGDYIKKVRDLTIHISFY